MADGFTYRVSGLREFLAVTDEMPKETKRFVRQRLRKVGEIVRDEGKRLFSAVDSAVAAGFRVYVRKVGTVSVEQSQGRTTGDHPEFAGLQLRRGLYPAVDSKEAETVKEFEQAIEDIEERFYA